MPVVLCRRNPAGRQASLSPWSHLGPLQPLVHLLMVAGGHGARASVHPYKCQRAKGLVAPLAWLCAVAVPATLGLSGTFTPALSTSQPWQGQGSLTQHLAGCSPPGDYLLPHLPPHPQLEGSPSFLYQTPAAPTPLLPPPSCPAAGHDKGGGLCRHQHCSTQCHFPACVHFPALTLSTLLLFST